ncbi:MAG: hypothetical protein Q7S65_00515 [Nanoarchaeota archaeon]|nr:hypothetical protein [Nanoarchaeota archaeon]
MKFSEQQVSLAALAILLLAFWGFYGFFDFSSTNQPSELSFYYPIQSFLMEAAHNGFFPHWIPYQYGGIPFFANAQNTVFRFFTLFAFFTENILVAAKLEVMVMMLIGALGMFFLAREAAVRPALSTLAVLVFLFNPFALGRSLKPGDEFLFAYLYVPLIFLFLVKALKSEAWRTQVRFALLAGLTMALQFHVGYLALVIYTGFLVALFFALWNLFSLSKETLKKSALVAVLFLVVVAGLAAVKLLPLTEFSKVSSLADKRSLIDAKGQFFDMNWGLFSPLKYLAVPDATAPGQEQIAVGFVGWILALCALASWRNKYVWFSVISLFALYLVATGSGLFTLLWKYFPGFDRQHHIFRILFLAPLFWALLVALGGQALDTRLPRRGPWRFAAITAVLAVALVLTMGVFTTYDGTRFAPYEMNEMIEENALFSYLGNQSEVFRVHDIDDSIGTTAAVFASANKVQIVQGSTNIWMPAYVNEYLWSVMLKDPLKFLGMLNVKYVYSNLSFRDPNLRLVKEFSPCESCRSLLGNLDDGPLLYENLRALPRAYTVDHAILALGDESTVKNAAYWLMLRPEFNPRTTVVVFYSGEPLDAKFLGLFDAVIVGALPKGSEELLRSYPGRLFPELRRGEPSVNESDIAAFLSSLNGTFEEAAISGYTPNGYVVTPKKPGWLVVSEKFAFFEAWKANAGALPLYRANGVGTALLVQDKVTLSYESATFKRGAWISAITLILLMGYFAYETQHRYSRLQRKEDNPESITGGEETARPGP